MPDPVFLQYPYADAPRTWVVKVAFDELPLIRATLEGKTMSDSLTMRDIVRDGNAPRKLAVDLARWVTYNAAKLHCPWCVDPIALSWSDADNALYVTMAKCKCKDPHFVK